MSTSKTDPVDLFTGPQTEAFKLWISFWPVAPFFGVEWRFAGAMSDLKPFEFSLGGAFAGAAAEKAAPAPAPAPVAAEPVVAPVAEPEPEAVAEAVAEPEPAPEPEVVAEAVAEPAPEPVAEAAQAEPEVEPEEEPVAEGPLAIEPAVLFGAAPDAPDDLKMIKGIGPSLESQLNALGIYRFDQIAGFSDENLVWVDAKLSTFKGRCFRDDWIGQAKDLIV